MLTAGGLGQTQPKDIEANGKAKDFPDISVCVSSYEYMKLVQP
jgi:hypothetical protein